VTIGKIEEDCTCNMFQPEELKHNTPYTTSAGTGIDLWTMFRACCDGDLPTVKQLISKDSSLAGCEFEYRKPIYFAVRENQVDIADFLLDHDQYPLAPSFHDSLLDIARDRGYHAMQQLLESKLADRFDIRPEAEPLAAAIRANDLSTVQLLLNTSPHLLHVADARGNQPIHWAVMTRQPEIIDELMTRGADIDVKRIDGARPIQLTNGDYHFRGWRDVPKDHPVTPRDVLNYLRTRGAHCDICTAAHIGDIGQVQELLEADPSLANRPSDYVSYYACSGTPIRNAAAGGHLNIVKLLLERGADPNLPEEGIATRGHALYSAATNGYFEVAKLLLEHGAYPNVEVESSADTLSRVISNGDTKMLELLCSYGASRAVHLLACFNDLQTAAAVFSANPALADDPDALANAAGEGHELFVRLMLRYQPDLPQRVTFPRWSVGAATPELNELLFTHGMNPSRANWLGITPLHEFARTGDIDKATLFLNHGADVHARDDDLRSTPLGWAARFGQMAMVELLLVRGAKTNLPDDLPWATPLAWAVRRGHQEIAELLKRHGAT
jgi:ankyrin repeat protein